MRALPKIVERTEWVLTLILRPFVIFAQTKTQPRCQLTEGGSSHRTHYTERTTHNSLHEALRRGATEHSSQKVKRRQAAHWRCHKASEIPTQATALESDAGWEPALPAPC